MQLAGKVAIVTGAGSGIAKATAILFAQEGAKVVALGRTPAEIQVTVDEIRGMGHEAMPAVADISQAEQIKKVMDQVATHWGRLDIVIANAGINGKWAPIEELTPEDWDKTLNVNLKGTFLTLKYAVPYLKRQGGSVVITSSVNGTRIFSNTGATAYSSSKAGQVALAKMAAVELGRDKVRVNVVCPGAISTNINESTTRQNLDKIGQPVEYPEGRIPLTGKQPGTSEQVAQLMLFLASDASSHITGSEIWIDGGESLVQG